METSESEMEEFIADMEYREYSYSTCDCGCEDKLGHYCTVLRCYLGY